MARGALRTFTLGRMSEPTLTGERFVRPKDFGPKKELSASFGVMKGQGDYQVVIELDAWLVDVLRARYCIETGQPPCCFSRNAHRTAFQFVFRPPFRLTLPGLDQNLLCTTRRVP